MNIWNWFRRKRPAADAPRERPKEITDEQLEALIERAGRHAVFSRAADNGWGPDNPPPKWVWVVIAHELLAANLASGKDRLH